MFSERLKQLRKEKGLTQIDLAKELGVSGGTVAMWETGKRNPSFEMFDRLTEIFDKHLDYILGTSDDAGTVKRTDDEIEQLGAWTVDEDCRKIMKDYMSLDSFGKAAVESIIQVEKLRCMEK